MACAKNNLKIPRGFAILLEKLATEVLREQPNDIVSFSAVYFQELLKDRECKCHFLGVILTMIIFFVSLC